MVWDNNSNQIVVLNSEETENCANYWLPIGEVMKCDSFTVILREENFDMDFVIRDFLLQSIDEDYEFTCRMITASYWPDSCTPVKSAFDLINKVKMFRIQSITANTALSNTINYSNANLSPLIVHDLYGGHRAASFCALYTFQDLIQLENSVNVYELAKMYHLKRPDIWNNKNNIMFLYEAVECLFEEMKSNSQYQFNNFVNFNIEHHFSNFFQPSQNLNSNRASLTLLPSNCQTGTPINPNIKTNQATLTLPNLSSKYQQRSLSVNEAIGTRLHNFQTYVQHTRHQSGLDLLADPSSTVPLNSTQTPSKPHAEKALNLQTKTNIIDIPKLIPFFNNNSTNNNHDSKQIDQTKVNYRSSSNVKSNKARKFMNTMMLKSASFKRALFQNSAFIQRPASAIIRSNAKEEVKEKSNEETEQKPSVILSLSSGPSSATTSSS